MFNNRNLVRTVGLALALLVLSATSVLADAVTFTGTTAGGPTWNRPLQNGDLPPAFISPFATNVPYSVTTITVSVSGMYTFQSTGTSPLNWDNYTFLYQDSFNPGSPLTNVLIGDDDNPTVGLSGFSINLTAGTTYYFIVTGFSNNDSGAWSTFVEGPGAITVPEPMTLLLLGTGLAGVAAKLRRRKTS